MVRLPQLNANPSHGSLLSRGPSPVDKVDSNVESRQHRGIDHEFCRGLSWLEVVQNWRCNPFLPMPPPTRTPESPPKTSGRGTPVPAPSPTAPATSTRGNKSSTRSSTAETPTPTRPPASPSPQEPVVPPPATGDNSEDPPAGTPSRDSSEPPSETSNNLPSESVEDASSPEESEGEGRPLPVFGTNTGSHDGNTSTAGSPPSEPTHRQGSVAGASKADVTSTALDGILFPTSGSSGGGDETANAPGSVGGAKSGSSNTGAIVGGVLGALALIGLLIAAFLVYRRRVRRSRVPPSAEFMQRYGNSAMLHAQSPYSPIRYDGLVGEEQVPGYTQGNYQLPFRDKA
ncbi:hypothetical protein CC1G_05123 [Coprinopsis cinerea okayama7|uniref:Uncharacterized protein n=1 Tax=Coprinopsis cinerea (strain Okayama-7 / 130 / ATCC MYA-4618 / FGSC 9003) TaxID=240176 RepID=A8NFX8_COPC7|nr:hypothetical protein CC1G_05123 [Coprinopsis cinerea okayama7\|eukprot:XP_001833423.2 hypothetical protein CC1G_05123 [Coprinopsis cinerea okayama7\